MTVDTSNTVFLSQFSGLGNVYDFDGRYDMPGFTISANNLVVVATLWFDINNTNALTSINVNLGIESARRPITGWLHLTVYSGASPSFDIILIPYYTDGKLAIQVIIGDDTGLSNNIPDLSFSFRINTYSAPF